MMDKHIKFIYTQLLSSSIYLSRSVKKRLYNINNTTRLDIKSGNQKILYHYSLMYNYDVNLKDKQ